MEYNSCQHDIATHSLYHYYSLKRVWWVFYPIWLSVIVVEGSNTFCKSKLTASWKTLCTIFWSKVPTILAPYQPADCGYINGVNPSCKCRQFFFRKFKDPKGYYKHTSIGMMISKDHLLIPVKRTLLQV